jgi:hypothetical protein
MAVQLSADVLDRLKCTFVQEIFNKIQETQLGFNCTTYSDEELYTMMNYVFIMESGCTYDPCDIDIFCSPIPAYVEICSSTEVAICNMDFEEVDPVLCDIYNFIELT